ncbi:uncharacterized protein [Chironomus tepperi]|uniref:uncharacterized protein n=1 Tax=Chironomus tepperi TaxID=113505 RepID=UPI00391F1EEE
MKILVSIILLSFATQIHGKCNVCNTTTLFACFSIDQYIPCDATGVFNLTGLETCGTMQVCNNNVAGTTPCVPIANGASCKTPHVQLTNTTTSPTTTTTTTSTTTISTPTTTTTTTLKPTTPIGSFNANTFCANRGHGRYPHPSFYTCDKYVFCYSIDGVKMIGAVYPCVGTTQFNPNTLYCDPNYTC